MKKNSISTAVLASLAGIAGIANISNAVNINPDGTGQVLIYPYYTVNAGNMTLLSIVNTTNRGKAVKVRILEGRNSQEVLDFNVFLSREDVWTAGISSMSPTGAGVIGTTDTSCTSPAFSSSGTVTPGGVPFVTFRNTLYANDSVSGLERTREGHIEIIEMVTLTGLLEAAITHNNDVPVNCNVVNNVQPSDFTVANAPTGGLFGGAGVINIANGTYTNYSATAIDAFWGAGEFGYTPAFSTLPSLTNADTTSLILSNGRVIRSTWGNLAIGTPTTPGQRIDAVSALFMGDSVLNEYSTLTGNNEASEWVVTFPTKRFYINDVIVPIPPFTRIWNPTTSQACEQINTTAWNREELVDNPDFSPSFGTQSFCFESNILTFNQPLTITGAATGTSSASRILGSTLARNINTPRLFGAPGNSTQAGWTRVNLSGINTGPGPSVGIRLIRRSAEGHQFVGLPVLGFWAVSIENNNATPGVKGFYGGAFDHKRNRRCVDAVNPQASCTTL